MFEALKKCIEEKERSIFVHSLGYKKIEKGLQTLKAFLKVDTLYEWIKTGRFDFRYSAEEFVLAAAKECGFSEKIFVQEIEKAKARQIEISKLHTAYIFIDTNFKRTTQPIHVLVFSQGLRMIQLDKEDFYDLSKDERLSQVAELVTTHYKTSEGKLVVWGNIHYYNFHDIDGRVYVFDTAGKLIKKDADVSESVATLKI